MAILERMPDLERRFLEALECPVFDHRPWVQGPPLRERRVAIISTAGLHLKEDRPFTLDPGDYYRVIPGSSEAKDLVMSHVSANFDRSGYQQDWNVVFPLDRLKELRDQGRIGSVAEYHYSFMGAHDPVPMESAARSVAALLREDRVDGALLIPV